MSSNKATGGRPVRLHRAFGIRAEASRIAPGLHVVATPIGNLGDVSFRALSTLAAASAVLAEDHGSPARCWPTTASPPR